MRDNNRLLAVVAVVGAVLLAWGLIRFSAGDDTPQREAPPRRAAVATPRPATTTQTLSRGSGSGNEVSDDFTVPDGCGRQELTYEGAGDGFINFRVYDTTGFPSDSAIGPTDLEEEEPTGAALWTLDAGAYSIEVTAHDARWEYVLVCR